MTECKYYKISILENQSTINGINEILKSQTDDEIIESLKDTIRHITSNLERYESKFNESLNYHVKQVLKNGLEQYTEETHEHAICNDYLNKIQRFSQITEIDLEFLKSRLPNLNWKSVM